MADIQLSADLKLGNQTSFERQVRELEKRVSSSLRIDNSQPLGKLSSKISEFDKSLEAANARVIAFGASASVIAGVSTAIKEMVVQSIRVEKSLTDINVLLNLSSSSLSKFGNELFTIGKSTGQSFDEVAKAATEFSRQGLGVEDILKRTNSALILTRLSGLDAAKSVETLTAAINSFQKEGLDAQTIVNKLATVDAKFAVSSRDLAEGLSRVGATAQDAGVNIDQLIALITTAQQRTARGGAVIGNALKSIFTRISRTDTLDQLEQLGVAVRDLEGKTLPAQQILDSLAKSFDTLGSSQKAAVSEMVAGLYQVNQFKSLITDLSSANSTYTAALKTSSGAQDEAISRNEALNKSLSSLANAAEQNFAKLSAQFGKSLFGPSLERVFGQFNEFADQIDGKGIGEKVGKGVLDGIGSALSGPGLIFGGLLSAKLLTQFGRFTAEALTSLTGIGEQSTRVKDVQQGINNLLSQEPALQQAILQGTISQAEAEQKILIAIEAQIAAKKALAAATESIAISTVEQGVRYNPFSTNFKVKNKAEGYIPITQIPQEAIHQEIAGAQKAGYSIAPENVRAMRTQINGKPTTVVYNSREKVIHDFAGTGEPAIIPPNKKLEDLNNYAAGYNGGLTNYAQGGVSLGSFINALGKGVTPENSGFSNITSKKTRGAAIRNVIALHHPEMSDSLLGGDLKRLLLKTPTDTLKSLINNGLIKGVSASHVDILNESQHAAGGYEPFGKSLVKRNGFNLKELPKVQQSLTAAGDYLRDGIGLSKKQQAPIEFSGLASDHLGVTGASSAGAYNSVENLIRIFEQTSTGGVVRRAFKGDLQAALANKPGFLKALDANLSNSVVHEAFHNGFQYKPERSIERFQKFAPSTAFIPKNEQDAKRYLSKVYQISEDKLADYGYVGPRLIEEVYAHQFPKILGFAAGGRPKVPKLPNEIPFIKNGEQLGNVEFKKQKDAVILDLVTTNRQADGKRLKGTGILDFAFKELFGRARATGTKQIGFTPINGRVIQKAQSLFGEKDSRGRPIDFGNDARINVEDFPHLFAAGGFGPFEAGRINLPPGFKSSLGIPTPSSVTKRPKTLLADDAFSAIGGLFSAKGNNPLTYAAAGRANFDFLNNLNHNELIQYAASHGITIPLDHSKADAPELRRFLANRLVPNRNDSARYQQTLRNNEPGQVRTPPKDPGAPLLSLRKEGYDRSIGQVVNSVYQRATPLQPYSSPFLTSTYEGQGLDKIAARTQARSAIAQTTGRGFEVRRIRLEESFARLQQAINDRDNATKGPSSGLSYRTGRARAQEALSQITTLPSSTGKTASFLQEGSIKNSNLDKVLKAQEEIDARRNPNISGSNVGNVRNLFSFQDKARRDGTIISGAERNSNFANKGFQASFAIPLVGGIASEFASSPQAKRAITSGTNAVGSGLALGSIIGGPAGVAVAGVVAGFGALKAVLDNLNPSLEDFQEKFAKEREERERPIQALGQIRQLNDVIQDGNLTSGQAKNVFSQRKSLLYSLNGTERTDILRSGFDNDTIDQISQRRTDKNSLKNNAASAAEFLKQNEGLSAKKYNFITARLQSTANRNFGVGDSGLINGNDLSEFNKLKDKLAGTVDEKFLANGGEDAFKKNVNQLSSGVTIKKGSLENPLDRYFDGDKEISASKAFDKIGALAENAGFTDARQITNAAKVNGNSGISEANRLKDVIKGFQEGGNEAVQTFAKLQEEQSKVEEKRNRAIESHIKLLEREGEILQLISSFDITKQLNAINLDLSQKRNGASLETGTTIAKNSLGALGSGVTESSRRNIETKFELAGIANDFQNRRDDAKQTIGNEIGDAKIQNLVTARNLYAQASGIEAGGNPIRQKIGALAKSGRPLDASELGRLIPDYQAAADALPDSDKKKELLIQSINAIKKEVDTQNSINQKGANILNGIDQEEKIRTEVVNSLRKAEKQLADYSNIQKIFSFDKTLSGTKDTSSIGALSDAQTRGLQFTKDNRTDFRRYTREGRQQVNQDAQDIKIAGGLAIKQQLDQGLLPNKDTIRSLLKQNKPEGYEVSEAEFGASSQGRRFNRSLNSLTSGYIASENKQIGVESKDYTSGFLDKFSNFGINGGQGINSGFRSQLETASSKGDFSQISDLLSKLERGANSTGKDLIGDYRDQISGLKDRQNNVAVYAGDKARKDFDGDDAGLTNSVFRKGIEDLLKGPKQVDRKNVPNVPNISIAPAITFQNTFQAATTVPDEVLAQLKNVVENELPTLLARISVLEKERNAKNAGIPTPP